MRRVLLIALLLATGYVDLHPIESKSVFAFFQQNGEIHRTLSQYMEKEDVIMAMSVVAPEISQFSRLEETVQSRLLLHFYVQQGKGNFSIGPFQMKPSFVEDLERRISRDSTLLARFSDILLSGPTEREERYDRIVRLQSLQWQVKYLAVFWHLASRTLQQWDIPPDNRLRYFATLYNGGLHLTQEQVEHLFQTKTFPHWGNVKYNYASVAEEFYQLLSANPFVN